MMNKPIFKIFTLTTVWSWLIAFALIPYMLILIASFLSHNSNTLLTLPLTFRNYFTLLNSLYFIIFLKSFYLAGACTIFCLLLGYPFAYILAKIKIKHKEILLLLVIIPFWTSSLIRSYAMIAILKTKGILNTVLLFLGIINAPLQLLYTNSAVIIGLVYNLLPFMILPLYANIERLDQRLIDAALDLGAKKTRIFKRIILPLTKPGILAGSILVFLPAMTLFYIPTLLGGAKSMLLGNLIQDQFLFSINWPMGSAISIMLTLIMAGLLLFYWRSAQSTDGRDLL
ncbi:MAG: ABC transporter permease subunit [Gammaproteobacteria bacterium]